jgi:hypothetical protein
VLQQSRREGGGDTVAFGLLVLLYRAVVINTPRCLVNWRWWYVGLKVKWWIGAVIVGYGKWCSESNVNIWETRDVYHNINQTNFLKICVKIGVMTSGRAVI